MSYAYLRGGFSKTAIGKVIRTRIEAGIEENIHDASQWLEEFGIPQEAYDIQAIMRERKNPDFDPASITAQRLSNPLKEDSFFLQLMAIDPSLRSRLNLSSKEGMAETLFSDPETQVLYSAAVMDVNGQPLYKHPDFSFKMLRDAAMAIAPGYVLANTGNGKEETTFRVGEDMLKSTIDDIFRYKLNKAAMHALPNDGRISETVRDLRLMGEARKNYIQDTQKWLLRHATSPSDRLKRVWRDRGPALAAGVEDNAAAIEAWQKEKGFLMQVELLEASGRLLIDYGFTAEEILSDRYKSARNILLGSLSAENTVEAISKLHKWSRERGDNPKLLPPDFASVVLDEGESGKSREYKLEIFADGDPRGFTIGEETGCCMTLHGASKSCIEAGYTRPDAGFLAIYPDGAKKAGAQSFWYIHPNHPDILVLDNIEANAGRDMERMAEVYRKGLQAYFETHPETGIKQVYVGTGYTDIELGNAPHVEPVPKLKREIYTDAHTQRLLLDLR